MSMQEKIGGEPPASGEMRRGDRGRGRPLLDNRLPIAERVDLICEKLRAHPTVLLVGETGSGKTTQMPFLLMDVSPPDSRVAITQPRRVAVRSVSRYVAGRYGCRVGEEIGYRVRHDDHTTDGTRATFMTDGIVLRELQGDPLLMRYDTLVVDEAHERSLNIDIVLGLARRAQAERKRLGKKPLRIVVMSATLEKEKFQKYFAEAPLVEVPGRLHPVEITHAQHETRERDYPLAAAEQVRKVVAEKIPGDILIFMPGKAEIDKTINEIEKTEIPDLICYPLHGEMEADDQDRVFAPTSPGKRKIIVATNVAETSVTVPGITVVIDSGLIRQTEYEPSSGIQALRLRPHAKSGCVQRAGRAGRLAPGRCFRLYTEDDFKSRADHQVPEIQRSDLAHVVLQMKQMGIPDVEKFPFIDPPSPSALEEAVSELRVLGALDEKGEITDIGEFMAGLPLEPKIARMVTQAARLENQAEELERHARRAAAAGETAASEELRERAKKTHCTEGVCTIAAFFSARDVFIRPPKSDSKAQGDAVQAHRKFKTGGSDFLTLLKLWRAFEAEHFNLHDRRDRDRFFDWCRQNFIRGQALEEAGQVRYQLFQALRRNGVRAVEGDDPIAVGQAIAAGLIGNLAERRWEDYRRLRDGQSGKLPDESAASSGAPYIVFRELRRIEFVDRKGRKGAFNLLQTIQPVKAEWIREIAPQLVEERPGIARYNVEQDRVLQEIGVAFKGSSGTFATETRAALPEEAAAVFAQALAGGHVNLGCYHLNQEALKQLKALYHRSRGRVKTPPDMAAWYEERLAGASSAREARVIEKGLRLAVDDFCPPALRAELEQYYPESVVIAGKEYALEYMYSPPSGWGERTEGFKGVLALGKDDIMLLALKDIPVVGSAQAPLRLTLKALIGWKEFVNTDLLALQKEAESSMIEQAWADWKEKPKPEIVVLAPLAPLPSLDDKPPLFYAERRGGTKVYACPAVVGREEYVEQTGKYELVYRIEYFFGEEEARTAQAAAEAKRTAENEEERRRQESVELMRPAEELLAKVMELTEESKLDGLYLGPADKREIADKVATARISLAVKDFYGRPKSPDAKKAMELLSGVKRLLEERAEETRTALASMPPAEELLALVKPLAEERLSNMYAYGLSHEESDELRRMMREAEGELRSSRGSGYYDRGRLPQPRQAIKLLETLKTRLEELNSDPEQVINRQMLDGVLRGNHVKLVTVKGGLVESITAPFAPDTPFDFQTSGVSIGRHGAYLRVDGKRIVEMSEDGRPGNFYELEDGVYAVGDNADTVIEVRRGRSGRWLPTRLLPRRLWSVEHKERPAEYPLAAGRVQQPFGGQAKDGGFGTLAEALRVKSGGKEAGGREPEVLVMKKKKPAAAGGGPAVGGTNAPPAEKPKVEEEETMTPELRAELAGQIDFFTSIIADVSVLPRPRPQKEPTARDKALSRALDDAKEIRTMIGEIRREIQSAEAKPASIRGRLGAVRQKIETLLKRGTRRDGSHEIYPAPYNSGWVEDYKAAWEGAPERARSNSDAQEYIAAELVTEAALVEKIREALAGKIGSIRQSEVIDWEELISEALSGY